MSAGLQLLRAIIDNSARTVFRQLDERFFTEDELPAFRFVASYFDRYGGLPSVDICTDNQIPLYPVNGPVDYFRDVVKNRAIYNLYFQRQQDLMEMLQRQEMDRFVSTISNMAREMSSVDARQDTYTMVEAMQMVIADFEEAQRHPGMRGVTYGWPTLDDVTGGARTEDLITIVARPGVGKAQPLTEPVLMADGTWKRMGDIQIGDELASPTGAKSTVAAIHPQGDKDVYRVVFRDGRDALCCADHLWEVKSARWPEARVVDTLELIRLSGQVRHKGRLSIRLVSGDFGQSWAETLSPYALGALLGDGGMSANFVSFTTEDDELVAQMDQELPAGHGLRHYSRMAYRVTNWGDAGRGKNVVSAFLRRHGLMGKLSTEKHIPEFVFRSDYESRLAVLQGLMDTDGTVSATTGTPVFACASPELARGVQRLAWSLGASAKLTYKANDHAGCWSVFIRHPEPETLMRLSRKRALARKTQYSDRLRLTIDRVERVGVAPCQCITVTDPNHLYVTRDYVVTHNSFSITRMACMAWGAGHSIGFVSMEMGAIETARRVLAMGSGVNADFIQRGHVSPWGEEQVRATVERVSGMPPFHMMVGDLSKSVRDVDAMIQEHDPDAIYVDASYLLRPTNDRDLRKRFELASQTMRELKSLAISRRKPIIQTVQFNRSQKADEEMSIDNIGQTDEVGQISSLVLGVRKGSAPNETTTRNYRVIKNRHGADGIVFDTRFDHSPFNMDEIEDAQGDGTDENGDYDGTQGPAPARDEWTTA